MSQDTEGRACLRSRVSASIVAVAGGEQECTYGGSPVDLTGDKKVIHHKSLTITTL